jgi:transmembrane sensor
MRFTPLKSADGINSDCVNRDRAPKRLRRINWVSAVAVALALASAASAIDPMHVHYYETSVGEHKTIRCGNGSITLNTQSRIAVPCARTLLRVHLLRGEALFRVASDPSKTVTVLAGDAQIVNFGTVFSVRHREDQTTVTVVEGTVQLSVLESIPHGSSLLDGRRTRTPPPLRSVADMVVWAGQRGSVVRTGSRIVLGSQTLNRSQITQALLWQSGVLAFQNETVAEVVSSIRE